MLRSNFHSRHTLSHLAILYAAYRRDMKHDSRKWGRCDRMLDFCLECEDDFFMERHTISHWVERWNKNDGYFCYGDLPRVTSGPRVLTAHGRSELSKVLPGSNYRTEAKDHKFESSTGGMVSVSRKTVKREADSQNLVLSLPKKKKIRAHYPHHKRGRVLFCRYVVKQPDSYVLGITFSDEMLWPITFSANPKNDVILVPAGTQKTTNISRHTKGDEAQAFSSFQMIDQYGLVVFYCYTERFTVDFFYKLNEETVAPALKTRKDAGVTFTVSIHDHVTNSMKLFVPSKMDAVYGRDKWMQHCPPICREHDGWIYIKERKGCKAHKRKHMVPCEECVCEMKQPLIPSSSPDLFLVENMQGYLRQLVGERIKRGEVEWKGSVQKKMKIVKDTVRKLDLDKAYFTKLYGSLRKRYQWVADHGGELYSA